MRFQPDEVNFQESPLYDYLWNGVGISALQNGATLLAQNNNSDPALSNMALNGQIASGGVFVAAGLRGVAWFESLATSVFEAAYGETEVYAPAYSTNVTTDQARALMGYKMLAYGCILTLNVTRVPLIQIPWYTIPAAGGPQGFTTVQGQNVVNNGGAGFGDMLRFSNPFVIDSLQNFNLRADFSPIQPRSIAGAFTGYGQGSADVALPATDTRLFINTMDCIKQAGIRLEGDATWDII